MSKKVRAIKFDRVSSAQQKDGYSLDSQRDNGLAYALKNDLSIVRTWSVDESASKEEDRTEFFEMIEFVKRENISAVIFDKVDRACRGFKSAVLIEELIEKHGVRFHFSRESLAIDRLSNPTDKLRFYLGVIFGKHQIDNLRSEIFKGQEAKRRAGIWSGKAPFGYRNVVKDGKAVIGIHEQEFPIAREVFQMYSTGNYGFDELAQFVAARVPKRKRKKRRSIQKDTSESQLVEIEFTKRLIEEMISNPFYYGTMKIKGELIPASHQPAIPKELFDACQKIRGIRSAQARSKRKGLITKPLMGVFTCGECDHAVTGEAVKKNSGKVYVYYRCANHKCAQKRKRVEQGALFDLIKKAFEPFQRWTPKATKVFIEALHASLGDLELYTQKMTGELAVARMELKKRIEALDLLKADGRLSDREYEAAISVPMKLLEDNKLEIQAYQEADLATFRKGCEVIQLFQKAYDYMMLDGNELEKVKLITAILSNPKLKDRTIGYEYEKPLDVLLTLTTVPVWWRRRELNPRPQEIHI